MTYFSRFAFAACVALVTAGAARAQDAAAPAGLSIELNEIAPSEKDAS